MKDTFAKRLHWLAEREWLHKSVRTFIVVAPGLGSLVATGDQRGVMFAFAALCLPVPHGDRFYCILIGVTIGTMFMLILSSQRVSNVSRHLVEKIRRSEAAAG
jgi:hypothetical protein